MRCVKLLLTTTALLCLFGFSVQAQTVQPTISARIEPDSIAIGDQFMLTIEIDRDIVQQVFMPDFADGMVMENIEIIREYAEDTLSRDGRRVKLAKRYLLTSFDEGIYDLSGFPALYVDKNITDTLRTKEEILLQVGTFDIDTENDSIKDIKMPVKMPLKFGEISGYLLTGLLVTVLIAVGIWLLVRYRKKMSVPLLQKPREIIPPHIKAISELENLHNKKLWQNNRHKAYYTRLTDIIREYIDGRWGVNAMEMTTEETIRAIRPLGIPERVEARLETMLRTADLVKFAKYTPDAEENENSFSSAYYFVEETKFDKTAEDEQ